MFVFEKDSDYYKFIQSSFASSFILNREMYEKANPERLVKFVLNYGYLSQKLKKYEYQHFLLEEQDVQNFQREFRDFIGVIYGEHAKKILEERPNITPFNIDNFMALDKRIYDNFGANFVHQLLNYDYNLLFQGIETNLKATQIIERIINDDNSLKGFKCCIDLVSETTPHTLYNYSKAFLAYSRFADLFDEIHDKVLTKEQLLDIKDAVVSRPYHITMSSLSETAEFKQKVKDYYDTLLLSATNIEQVKHAIFGRFFGLDYMNKKAIYSRTNRNINELLKFYNVDKLIKYHNIQKQLGYSEIDLSETEINILRVLSAINKIGGAGSAEILGKLYTTLEKAENIIRPSDIEKLIEKIPQIYETDLKRTLSDIDDFERACKNHKPGIHKVEVPVMSPKGKLIRIPVYQLRGIPFSALITSVETNLSLPGPNKEDIGLGQNWMEYENGTSHISASYITHDIPAAIEFTSRCVFGDKTDKINYLLGKNVNIISMGPTDIFSTYVPRHPDSTTLESTNFLFSADLAIRSKSFDGFNEVSVTRYSLDKDRYGAKIIPPGIFKRGDMPSSRILEVAAEFTEYLIENKLVDEGYVTAVVMYNPDFYQEKQSDISSRRKFSESLNMTINDVEDEKKLISIFTENVENMLSDDTYDSENQIDEGQNIGVNINVGRGNEDDNPDSGV